ncbi:hypothetical protein [Amycolatopsis keratiniphila]|uniref:Uncharacterized protein n=1 Tax=Amycolatopsis keratiniphila subsp. keratiniphila TaxID=227715 RepID=A0A1W2M234_9PSEU|nr:hypothetical protein [Amycolatopsis keratiniphila]ONF73946.1 hypothetical protein AVR91_0204245 [Amycolatopsis keratiniphila subsp. keratiniphila]
MTAAHDDLTPARAAGYPGGPGPESAVRPLPTIGVDPGQTWTAAVLRVGDFGEHGWTMGPTDKFGTITRDALNEVDNWDGFARYVGRLIDALDMLVDYANTRYGEVRMAVEVPGVPIGYQPGSAKKFQRLPLRDWIIPRQVAAAVIGQFPEAKIVRPDHYGRRPSSEYPKELRGTRPPEWGPNETPRRERDHERAAYDIAGVAAVMPR